MQEVNSIKHSNFIPSGWKSQKLIDFCINSKRAIVDGPFGSNLKSEHFREFGIPVINSSFVTDFIFKADKYVYVDEELFLREIRSKVEPGDIVMAKIGARCGSTAIMPVNHPISILSGNSLKISINTDENVTDFVWYILADLYQKNQMKDYKSVGAQPSISTPLLKEMKILRPPKIEQQKIAEILSTWDKAIETCQKTIEELQQRNRGLRIKLFSENENWKKEELGNVLKYTQPQNFLTDNFVQKQNENYSMPVLTANKSFVLGYTDERQGLYENLPVIIFDDFTTSSHYIDFAFKIKSSAIKLLTVKGNNDLKFCYHLLQLIKTQIGEHKRRWISEFEDKVVKIPELSEQKRIVSILDTAASELKHYEEKLSNLKLQKKGLMQQLLTGKVRVKI